jgi:molecular chaperone DnaK
VVPVAKVKAQPPPVPKPKVSAEVNERRAFDPRAEPDEPDVHTETGTLIMELSKPPARITFSPPTTRGPGGTEEQDLIDAGLQGLGARVGSERPVFADPRAEAEPTRPAFVAEVRSTPDPMPADTQVMPAMQMPPAAAPKAPVGPASVRLSDLPVPIQPAVAMLGEDDEVPVLEPFVEEPSLQGSGGHSAIMRAIMQAQPAPAEAGIRAREQAPLLIDVTPLSLRVETVGGFSDTLIQANSPVPCDRTRAQDNQTTVTIRVAQGESPKFAENTFLGELELSGIPPAARGEIAIEVTFELDADGILNVRAREPKTNRQTKAVMRLLGANTDAMDVERMMQAQAKHVVL